MQRPAPSFFWHLHLIGTFIIIIRLHILNTIHGLYDRFLYLVSEIRPSPKGKIGTFQKDYP